MTSTTDSRVLARVRRSILIQADAEHCWAALTGRIGDWWPMVGHSCTDDPQSALAFVDGDLVETGTDGQRFVWGSVSRWEPPNGLVMSWHPGQAAGTGEAGTPGVTEVEWRLTALDPGATLVEVLHRGWERLADPVGRRTAYENGWPGVVGALAGLLADAEQPSMWHILTHTPGPAADPDSPLQRQPGFAGHAQFLASLAADGLLVAAGPLSGAGQSGRGQTVVRGLDTEQATRRAQDDESVRSGFFEVAVQPWVVLTRG